MLELASAQVEKGVFELRLEGEGPRWARRFIALGPNRGRILALVLILGAASLNLTIRPAAFIFESGWTTSTFNALRYQAMLKWLIAGSGLVVWAIVFGARKEELKLVFDKSASKVFYFLRPQWNLSNLEQGEASFANIRKIEVFAPYREPQTPYGFVEIGLFDAQEKAEKLFRFKVLSEDQLKIYPANLGRFTGRDPFGDWIDPDSLPVT
ncbi:MAG: hypothetical protein ABIR96_00920 [Bdellovibrionota bacterium]